MRCSHLGESSAWSSGCLPLHFGSFFRNFWNVRAVKSDVRQFAARHGGEFVQRSDVGRSCSPSFLSAHAQVMERSDQTAEGVYRSDVLKCHVLLSFCLLEEFDPPRLCVFRCLLSPYPSTWETSGWVPELCRCLAKAAALGKHVAQTCKTGFEQAGDIIAAHLMRLSNKPVDIGLCQRLEGYLRSHWYFFPVPRHLRHPLDLWAVRAKHKP